MVPAKESDMTPDELVESHLDLAKKLAQCMNKKTPLSITFDELLSPAYLGLVKASRKFDPAKGNKFVTYASPAVNGAIIDYLRYRGWGDYRCRQRLAEKHPDRHMPELEQMDVQYDKEEYGHSKDVQDAEALAMDNPVDKRLISQEFFEKVFTHLPEQHRQIMQLYYIEGRSQDEIAEMLALSHGQVQQLAHTGRKLVRRSWTAQKLREMMN